MRDKGTKEGELYCHICPLSGSISNIIRWDLDIVVTHIKNTQQYIH